MCLAPTKMPIFKKISALVSGAKGMPHFILKPSSGLKKQSSQKRREKGGGEEEGFGFEVLRGNCKY